jgi:hypothetical protein
MADDHRGSSPFADLISDDESWKKPLEGLDAISDFNDKFNMHQNDSDIDPLLEFTNPTTPTKTQGTYDNVTFSASDTAKATDQSLMLDMSPFQSYPENFGGQIPSSPYFQSVEIDPPQLRTQQPSHLQNNSHRRSVSEPPGMHAPPMTFHRERHFLGNPVQPRAMPMKSVSKYKQPRQHPYTRGRVQQSPVVHPYPHQPQQYQQQHQQQHPPHHRPHFQRSQTTQPFHGPTSVPYAVPSQHYDQYMPMQQNPMPVPTSMPDTMQYVPARLCTPTRQTTPLQQHAMIDPSLTGSTEGRSMGMRSDPGKTMNIPVTVDELKGMISDAVRAAFFSEENKIVKRENDNDQARVGTPQAEADLVV